MESKIAIAAERSIPFQGRTMKVIGAEDFIAMKVFAGGPLDLVDAERAIGAGGATLDWHLTRSLAGRFGRQALGISERSAGGLR